MKKYNKCPECKKLGVTMRRNKNLWLEYETTLQMRCKYCNTWWTIKDWNKLLVL